MSYFALNHTWRNFCSMHREAQSSIESVSKMARAHHKSSAAYFGICALEAFINSKMRAHSSPPFSENEIIKKLRDKKYNLMVKLRTWPKEMIGHDINFPDDSFTLIGEIIEDRNHLTHSKTIGFETYDRLMQLDATDIVRLVSDYIVFYYEAEGAQFPYWVLGWNYLSPSEDGAPTLMNNQQFSVSLHSMGVIALTPFEQRLTTWHEENMKGHSKYESLSKLLAETAICQPKNQHYPRQPILCRRWWVESHRTTCGHALSDTPFFQA